MPTYTNTARYLLRKLTGSNLISDVDAGIAALADDIDGKMVGYSEGPASSRPASSPGSPSGKAGQEYRSTDSGLLEKDTGTGWVELAQIGSFTATWNPPSMANGASVSTQVLSGGIGGVFPVVVSLSTIEAGVAITGSVVPNGSGGYAVEVRLTNFSGATKDLASGTLKVRLFL